jgi:hypothetical protein
MRPTARALIGVVSAGRADHGANDGKLIHHGGDPREDFANLKSRDGRGNRFEFAPNLLGRLRLDVPHVLVGRAATQKNIDDRLGSSRDAGFCLGPKDIGQRQTADADSQGADLEEASPRNTIAKPASVAQVAWSKDGQHGGTRPLCGGQAALATAWSGGIQKVLDTPIQTENVAECNSFSIIAPILRLTMAKSAD